MGLFMVQLQMNIMENVEMTTAGMVTIMVIGDHGQSKQFSMDMEKQDWTLEIVAIIVAAIANIVLSEPI